MPALNINLNNRATTQYTNFNFNSFARFKGLALGANSDGLFELSGDNDNSVNIDAYFSLIATDFGIPNPKRLRYIYLGYEASGNLEVRVSVDELPFRTYSINSNKTGQQRKRVTIGRDGKGRYWSFMFKNVSGEDFSIDSVNILPVVRSSGHE